MIIFTSLLVASQISRFNHNMVLTGSKEMVTDLAFILVIFMRHARKSIIILLI